MSWLDSIEDLDLSKANLAFSVEEIQEQEELDRAMPRCSSPIFEQTVPEEKPRPVIASKMAKPVEVPAKIPLSAAPPPQPTSAPPAAAAAAIRQRTQPKFVPFFGTKLEGGGEIRGQRRMMHAISQISTFVEENKRK